MRKYVSLGSALMIGAVLGREPSSEIKALLAQKNNVHEALHLHKPISLKNLHKHQVKE